jgi:hypothetical protein
VLASAESVMVDGKELPVSRKYKDFVRVVLSILQNGGGPEAR